MHRTAKRATVLLVVLGIVMVFGVAFAAWLAFGEGSGFAEAGEAEALYTGEVTGTVEDKLYPGATGDVRIRIVNDNPYPIVVLSVSANGAVTSDAGEACDDSSGVTFTTQTDLDLAVGAGGETELTLAGAVAMDNSSDNTCQGATFTIPVTIVGESSG